MSAFEIKVESKRLQQAMAQSPRRLTREMDRTIRRIVLEMAGSAKGRAPKAFSTLTVAINAIMVSPLEGLVNAGTNYARAVEEGTGIYGPQGQASGKMPPVENILDWIKVRRIEPNDPGMDQKDLAFVIARSIAVRGTPAQPFMAPTFEEYQDIAIQRIDTAIERALQ